MTGRREHATLVAIARPLIGVAAAQKKGFSIAAGILGGLLLGPLAFLMFFVSGVSPLLVQRDQMITLLARADPAVAERLADAYLSYRRATGTLPSHSAGQ